MTLSPGSLGSVPDSGALLRLDNVDVSYARRGHSPVRAVIGASLTVRAGEIVGLVGESGCGKSTLGRAAVGLIAPSAGQVHYRDEPLAVLGRSPRPSRVRSLQMVFQDPYASLNPRRRVGHQIADAARLGCGARFDGSEADDYVASLLERVGLSGSIAHRYPHEFSGGQAQRIGIARALVVEPQLLICDEPVSALDVSIKSQIINLLLDLRAEQHLTYIFVAHDLATVRHIADRVMVLYLGRVMEITDRDALYARPLHPYTRLLLSAVPIPDPVRARARRAAPGRDELPSPLALPSGCTFRTRCPLASERCAAERPPLRQIDGRVVACHHAQAAAGQP